MFEFPEIAATHRELRAALIDRLKKVPLVARRRARSITQHTS
jgi:hypothetical protein